MADTLSNDAAILETLARDLREGTDGLLTDAKGPDEEAVLSDTARQARWQSRRPDIAHLKDGVATLDDGTVLPLFNVGDRIVADIRTNLLAGLPWLETVVGKVADIDDDTGVVVVLDEDTDQRAPSRRYVSFKDGMHDLRLAPARGNPFDAAKIKAMKPALKPGEVRRGRGRPPGSKNRPKAIIVAEREARKASKRGDK